jgi:hypothetical protein
VAQQPAQVAGREKDREARREASADTPFGTAMAQERACEVAARAEAARDAAGAVGDVREALRRDLEALRGLALGPPLSFGLPLDPCGDGPLGPLEPLEPQAK